MVFCSGIKNNGKRCRRHFATGLKYCWTHRLEESKMSKNIDVLDNIDKTAFNVECPVCFGEEGNMIILSCLHRFHEDCLECHTDLNCPRCRQRVVNWPPILKNKIEENSKQFTSELDEEDRQNLIEQQINDNRNFLSQLTMFLQPPPQIEVATALNFLRDRGIPTRYLPRKIKISVRRGQPRPQPGVIYHAVIGQVQENIQEDIHRGIIGVVISNEDSSSEFYDEGDSDDESSSESDEEDPFFEENMILEDLDFNCNVVEKD